MNDDLEMVKNLVFVAALEKIANGKSKKDACEELNISVSTFDRALAEDNTLATQFVLINRKVVADRYTRIVETRAALIDDLLDEQTDADKRAKLTVGEKISLEKYFREIQEITEKELGFLGGPAIDPKAAEHSLLTPPPTPVLRKVRGKISQRVTEVEFDFEEMPDKVDPNFIEGEITDQV